MNDATVWFESQSSTLSIIAANCCSYIPIKCVWSCWPYSPLRYIISSSLMWGYVFADGDGVNISWSIRAVKIIATHAGCAPWPKSMPLSTPWYDHKLSISMLSIRWVFVFACGHPGFPSWVLSGACLVTPTGILGISLTQHRVQLIYLVLLSCGTVCTDYSAIEVKWFAPAGSKFWKTGYDNAVFYV